MRARSSENSRANPDFRAILESVLYVLDSRRRAIAGHNSNAVVARGVLLAGQHAWAGCPHGMTAQGVTLARGPGGAPGNPRRRSTPRSMQATSARRLLID